MSDTFWKVLPWVVVALAVVGVFVVGYFRDSRAVEAENAALASVPKTPKTLLDEARRRRSNTELVAILLTVAGVVMVSLFFPEGFLKKEVREEAPYVLVCFFIMQWTWTRETRKAIEVVTELLQDASEERGRILRALERLDYKMEKVEADAGERLRE